MVIIFSFWIIINVELELSSVSGTRNVAGSPVPSKIDDKGKEQPRENPRAVPDRPLELDSEQAAQVHHAGGGEQYSEGQKAAGRE